MPGTRNGHATQKHGVSLGLDPYPQRNQTQRREDRKALWMLVCARVGAGVFMWTCFWVRIHGLMHAGVHVCLHVCVCMVCIYALCV